MKPSERWSLAYFGLGILIPLLFSISMRLAIRTQGAGAVLELLVDIAISAALALPFVLALVLFRRSLASLAETATPPKRAAVTSSVILVGLGAVLGMLAAQFSRSALGLLITFGAATLASAAVVVVFARSVPGASGMLRAQTGGDWLGRLVALAVPISFAGLTHAYDAFRAAHGAEDGSLLPIFFLLVTPVGCIVGYGFTRAAAASFSALRTARKKEERTAGPRA